MLIFSRVIENVLALETPVSFFSAVVASVSDPNMEGATVVSEAGRSPLSSELRRDLSYTAESDDTNVRPISVAEVDAPGSNARFLISMNADKS